MSNSVIRKILNIFNSILVTNMIKKLQMHTAQWVEILHRGPGKGKPVIVQNRYYEPKYIPSN